MAGGNAGSTTTIFYLSIDGLGKNTNLGYRSVPAVGGNSSNSGTASLTLPVNLNGQYWVIACADYYNAVAEDKSNNCAATKLPITISGADLQEGSVTSPAPWLRAAIYRSATASITRDSAMQVARQQSST